MLSTRPVRRAGRRAGVRAEGGAGHGPAARAPRLGRGEGLSGPLRGWLDGHRVLYT